MRSRQVRFVAIAAAAALVAAFGFATRLAGAEPPSTKTVGPSQPYLPHAVGDAKDDYHCFLLDPKLDRDVFVTDTRFRPTFAPIVHHIILFRVPPERAADARALDRRTPGTGWTCFGGSGVDDLTRDPQRTLNDAGWISAWAPSRSRTRLPSRVGVPLARGSLLVMQVHYSLYQRARPDRTRAVLSLVPAAGSSVKPLRTMLLPAPVELPCLPSEHGRLCSRSTALTELVNRYGPQSAFVPAGLLTLCGRNPAAPQATTTSTCQLRFDEPLTIQAAAGHMHLLGRSLTLELNPGTPNARTVIAIPRWDFRNQQIYVVSPPLNVATGDVLRVTCRYDQRRRQESRFFGPKTPRYVLWGEGSADEMCLGVLQVTNR